jgi:hypothetical protein
LEHLTTEELEAFVQGVPQGDPAALRRHLSACATCARRLAREARLEVALQHVVLEADASAKSFRGPHRGRHGWRVPLSIAATLLLVAGVGWVLALREAPMAPRQIVSRPAMSEHALSIPAGPAATMPGYGVVAPTDVCRHVTVPPPGWDAR